MTVGIQSTKTTVVRPLAPLERDIVSIYQLVYESLIVIDDNYLPQPGLCDSWEASKNGRSWTFHIRPNVRFSDGTPLTAYDIAATGQAILDRANDETASNVGYYGNLKYFVSSIKASNETTLTVRTTSERPYYGLLYALTFPVVKASEVNADNPLGSGPYYISVFSPMNQISLQANPNWWKNQPAVKSIHFVCHDTQKAVIESYQYARVDTCFTRSVSASQYKTSTGAIALDSRTNQLEVLLMNESYTKLASANVRKAIRSAINIEYIASNIYSGMVDRTDTPWIAGTWMYDNAIASGVNLDEARRLLEADGWGDSNEDGVMDKLSDDDQMISLTLNLYVYEEPDDDVRYQTATYIKDCLAQIGISVTIHTSTYTGIQTKLSAGSFHLALCSFAMDKCPDYGFLLMPGNTGNYGRYRSQTMKELCQELRKCVTRDDFQSQLIKIQEQFWKDCPFICLFYRNASVLTRSMYTTVRDVRELELLRGIESFSP